MFKNATIYRLGKEWAAEAAAVEQMLRKAQFAHCMPTQLKSTGWIGPRGIEHGALLESIGGQWIMKLMVEKKDLPGDVVNRHVDEKVAQIERDQDRKVGRKERREIKDSVVLALLPNAFTKRSAVTVWIDPQDKLLVIDSTSRGRLDEVITFMVKHIEGLQIQPLQTQQSCEVATSEWLLRGHVNDDFDFFGECELKAPDETKAAVKYSRHRLDIQEVQEHIRAGKRPQSLALSWQDRTGFVLTNTLQLKKIKLLDVEAESHGDEDPFDAAVATMTGELSRLIPALIEVMGGEQFIEL